MASKDWKLPDAQHKITEEKGLDIENESIQRQWEKTIVSFIRLEDAFSDIDVYDDTEEGEIPYVEQEDERSGTLDMNLIAQKLDEWQKASRNDVNRELINSCVAQITPLTNEEYRWVLDFQLTEVQSRNSATCTLDGFMEMARFRISFEEAKAFKASRNQGICKNEWHDLTVAVGIRTKT